MMTSSGNDVSNSTHEVGKVKERVAGLIRVSHIDTRNVVHGVKVGIALVIVTLIYVVNPLFERVGENGMWAIMTVVVMFEFYAGATLGKGINRIIGTLLGGGLGCLVAILGAQLGGFARPIIIAFSVFLFGGFATYYRQVPKLKKRYDYGFMIFILTFGLVAVSGVRMESVVEVGQDRMANIGIGFSICVFINLAVCPFWASNELHFSTASKFHKLATSIQGCLDEYFKMDGDQKENQGSNGIACKLLLVLNSKSNDELLANHAKWEPWHGKFGVHYPWDKYLEVGEHLRELAAAILSFQGCIQSQKQPQPSQRQCMRELCEKSMLTFGCILKELGVSIEKMEACRAKEFITPKLKSVKLHFSPRPSSCMRGVFESDHDQELAVATLNFLLMEMVGKIDILAQKVEELGVAAKFRVKSVDV